MAGDSHEFPVNELYSCNQSDSTFHLLVCLSQGSQRFNYHMSPGPFGQLSRAMCPRNIGRASNEARASSPASSTPPARRPASAPTARRRRRRRPGAEVRRALARGFAVDGPKLEHLGWEWWMLPSICRVFLASHMAQEFLSIQGSG